MKRKLLLFIIGIIILAGIWQMVEYLKLKKEAEKVCQEKISLNLDHKVDFIGMLDSYGVPFSPKVKDTFLDYLCEEARKDDNLSSKLDLYNLYINKTWNLEGELRNNISLSEHVLMQNYSIGFIRHKYGKMIRDDLHYSCQDNIGDQSIRRYISRCENPIILYSCAANDLFFYFDATPETLTFPKMINILRHTNEGIQLMGDGVAQNIDTLLECNPSAQIYVMGLYVPSSNLFIQTVGNPLIKKINQKLKRICDAKNQVYFVNVSCLSFNVLPRDFHPDQEGQKIIAVKLKESINKFGSEMNDENNVDNEDTEDNEDKVHEVKIDETEMVGKLYDAVINSNLPKEDYIECSVAIEQAFLDLGWEDVSEVDIRRIRPGFLSLW